MIASSASGDGGPEELDDAPVVAPADIGEAILKLVFGDPPPELSLEDDDLFPAQIASPRGFGGGGGRQAVGEKVVGGGANLGDVVDMRVFG